MVLLPAVYFRSKQCAVLLVVVSGSEHNKLWDSGALLVEFVHILAGSTAV